MHAVRVHAGASKPVVESERHKSKGKPSHLKENEDQVPSRSTTKSPNEGQHTLTRVRKSRTGEHCKYLQAYKVKTASPTSSPMSSASPAPQAARSQHAHPSPQHHLDLGVFFPVQVERREPTSKV